MNYATKMTAMAILMTAITAPTIAHAQRSVNPDRCNAKKMRIAARSFDCAARCNDRLTAKQLDQQGFKGCTEACTERRTTAEQKLSDSWLCKEKGPDPLRCAAKIAMAESDHYGCQADCGRHSPDPDTLKACKGDCDTELAIEQDKIMASPICKSGRAVYVP